MVMPGGHLGHMYPLTSYEITAHFTAKRNNRNARKTTFYFVAVADIASGQTKWLDDVFKGSHFIQAIQKPSEGVAVSFRRLVTVVYLSSLSLEACFAGTHSPNPHSLERLKYSFSRGMRTVSCTK